jgi:hypothetical protein
MHYDLGQTSGIGQWNKKDYAMFIGAPVGLISGIFLAYKLGIKAFIVGPLLGWGVAQAITHL